MNTELNIYQRINMVMKDISYVKKGGTNAFQKYLFTKHDDVTRLVRVPFMDHGIVALPTVVEHTHSEKQEKNGVAMLTELVIDIDFVNIDKPEDRFTIRGIGYGIDKNDLGPGKALSYAVKNIYLKVLGLETGEKDNEDTADEKNAAPAKKEPTPEAKIFREVRELLNNAKSKDETDVIWRANSARILTLPETGQIKLQEIGTRFDVSDDGFPGDD